jgi:alkylation response protein AidB-like acyl-CoA dehydrogenase
MVSESQAYFIRTQEQRELLNAASRLAERFAGRADRHDREGSFPFENFEELRQEGMLALTVPKRYGGREIGLYDMLLLLDCLAQGDGSTALGLGWHLGLLMNLRESQVWDEAIYRRVCEDVVGQGALINSCATEPTSGSPSRGGLPQTTARSTPDGWELNGHKTWSTLSPILHYFIVTAGVPEENGVGDFLIPRGTPGMRIVETWDSLGMRATGSHDLLLDGVHLPREALVKLHRRGEAAPAAPVRDSGGWLLHIPAVYIGIAAAAKKFAAAFAADYRPHSLPGPIAELPKVRERIGEMELELFVARSVLYRTAEDWDRDPDRRAGMRAKLAAAKHCATNAAIRVVDTAMRIVGGASLFKKNPLERYYRDVRAGLHNPPMDDVTVGLMAQEGLSDAKEKESP